MYARDLHVFHSSDTHHFLALVPFTFSQVWYGYSALNNSCHFHIRMSRLVKRTLQSQLWCGEKQIIEAFEGFIIYNEKSIVYFDSMPGGKELNCKFKKTMDEQIVTVTFLPYLQVIAILFFNREGNFYCQTYDVDFNKSPITTKSSNAPPREDYLSHGLCGKSQIYVYSYFKHELLFTILPIDEFIGNSKITLSGFNVYLLGKNEQMKACAKRYILTYTSTWCLTETKLWSDVAESFNVFDCDVLACSQKYLIATLFNSIYALDLNKKGKKTTIETDSIITSFSWITNSKAFLTTDSYQLFFINMNTMKLQPIPSTSLSIEVEDVIVTKSHIFLHNKLTGFYVFDIENSSKFGFIRTTKYIPAQEINLFVGVSHAYRTNSSENIISFTDGYNSILTKKMLDINILQDRFRFIKNQLFIGFYQGDDFLTKDLNSQLYLNGKVAFSFTDEANLESITPSNALSMTGISEIAESVKESPTLFNHKPVHASCFQVYNNFTILYDDKRKSMHIFPNNKTFYLKTEFTPKSIRIYNCDTVSVTFLLFDHQHINVYTQTQSCEPVLISHVDWGIAEPILDIDFSGSFDSLYVRTLLENVWQVKIPEVSSILISERFYFSHIFSLRHRLIGISSLENKIYCINYESCKINKLIRTFEGKLLQCSKISNSSIIVSTTTEMFEIKLEVGDERYYESALLGVTKASLNYDETQKLVHTSNGLYMVDTIHLRVHASILLPHINDVKVDKNIDRIIISVWNPNETKTAIILKVSYNKELGKFEIESQALKMNVVGKVLIEPTCSQVSFSGELYSYKDSDNFSSAIGTCYQPPEKDWLYVEKQNYYSYLTETKYFVVSDQSDGNLIWFDNVNQYFALNNSNFLIYKDDSLYFFDFQEFQLNRLCKLERGFHVGKDLKIQWIDTSLLTWDRSRCLWRSKPGYFITAINPSGLYEEYIIE